MKKIMFSDRYCLTKAVLDGYKTQTRRLAGITQKELDEFRVEYFNATFDTLFGLDLVETYIHEKKYFLTKSVK